MTGYEMALILGFIVGIMVGYHGRPIWKKLKDR